MWIVYLSEFEVFEEISNCINIAEDNFSYLVIKDEYVVFWNDETKVLGLLFSENTKNPYHLCKNGTPLWNIKK